MATYGDSQRGMSIPFMPARAVEDQVTLRGHRIWSLGNMNLLAPISVSMWKIWGNLTSNEVETLKRNAIQSISLLRDPQDLLNAFPLSQYDHHKCSMLNVRIHTKQDVQTAHGRGNKHTAQLWNVQRPYLRCSCSQNAANGCRGSMLWFDHSVWFMINNLGKFFGDEFPSLASKYGAFLIWMSRAAKVAIAHQVSFMYTRQFMTEAALEFAADPEAHLLSNYPSGNGLRKIERMIKPVSFSLANITPGQSALEKRPRPLNLNISPGGWVPRGGGSRGRLGSRGYSRGRGGRSSNYGNHSYHSPTHTPTNQQSPNSNEAFQYITASSSRQPKSQNSLQITPVSEDRANGANNTQNEQGFATSTYRKGRMEVSHVHARILHWDEDV